MKLQAEDTECGNVMQNVFKRLISKVEVIGNKVHSKHSLQTRRRTPTPLLRVMQFDLPGTSNPLIVVNVICFIAFPHIVR